MFRNAKFEITAKETKGSVVFKEEKTNIRQGMRKYRSRSASGEEPGTKE